MLLEQAEHDAEYKAHDGTDECDEVTLVDEDAGHHAVGSTQTAQSVGIVAFVEDEHRYGADDIETSHHQDEAEEEVGDELLYLHHLECGLLLFIAVLHREPFTHNAADGVLHLLHVSFGE